MPAEAAEPQAKRCGSSPSSGTHAQASEAHAQVEERVWRVPQYPASALHIQCVRQSKCDTSANLYRRPASPETPVVLVYCVPRSLRAIFTSLKANL
eukprot:3861433-Rhodomonas_salina.1